MGILSSDGTTKIEPNYNEIKQISSELNYYLVNNESKYGIINQNGNIVVYLEYDEIGIDESKFNTNGIENPYILFDNCIPVKQGDKWGIFDVNGKQIVPVKYTEMGCVSGTQSNSMNNNVIIIPEYEAIVLGENDKYGIISSRGELYIPFMLDSVYSVTVSGQDQFYMTFTRKEEQDGKTVEVPETYYLKDYFEQFVVPSHQEMHQNTNTPNETANAVMDTNTMPQEQSTVNSNANTVIGVNP